MHRSKLGAVHFITIQHHFQKTFTVNFLTKKIKINEGEIPQYYVENSHPAIMAPEIFDLVQQEIQKRKSLGKVYSNQNILSSKIICSQCGSFYGSKLWHSNNKYRRIVWQCNHKFDNKEKCTTPHIYDKKLKQAFIDVFNSLIENKAEIIENYRVIAETLTDTSVLDKKVIELQNECDYTFELLRKCVEENAHSAIDQEEYKKKYSALEQRFETAKNGLEQLRKKRLNLTAKRENIKQFLKILDENDLLTEFDDELWNATIESVKVYPNNKLVFTFKDGKELDWVI